MCLSSHSGDTVPPEPPALLALEPSQGAQKGGTGCRMGTGMPVEVTSTAGRLWKRFLCHAPRTAAGQGGEHHPFAAWLALFNKTCGGLHLLWWLCSWGVTWLGGSQLEVFEFGQTAPGQRCPAPYLGWELVVCVSGQLPVS